jgi:hypothetical protein
MSVFEIRYHQNDWTPAADIETVSATTATLPHLSTRDRAVATRTDARQPGDTRYWTGSEWTATAPAALR